MKKFNVNDLGDMVYLHNYNMHELLKCCGSLEKGLLKYSKRLKIAVILGAIGIGIMKVQLDYQNEKIEELGRQIKQLKEEQEEE